MYRLVHIHVPVLWASPPISTLSICKDAAKFGYNQEKKPVLSNADYNII